MALPARHKVKVGLCGVGTVGRAVWSLLGGGSAERIEARTGIMAHISHLGMRSAKPDINTAGIQCSKDVMAVADDPEIDILIEAIGGERTALALVLKAIANGKHVVTANKALIALHGEEIMAAAHSAGVIVRFEAAVAGGIPIIKAICEGLAANRISRIKGIVNGTANYILSALGDGDQTMAEALKAAQDAGYAEEDPSFDVEGIDSAHKITILAALALSLPLSFDRVYTEGISHISPQDITHAAEYGYRIKHLAIAAVSSAGYELRVHPALVPLSNPLATTNGSMNAISVLADATGATLYSGAGAGGAPTASAILADVADILRDTASPEHAKSRARIPCFSNQNSFSGTILDIGAIRSRHYLRMDIKDQPGVLSTVTQMLSKETIDVETVKQSDTCSSGKGDGTWKTLTLITHEIEGAHITRALEALRQSGAVSSDIQHIRIEEE